MTADKAPAKKATPKKRAPRKTPAIPEPDNPWDQQTDETTPAFAAFVIYRDFGITRSLRKVAEECGKNATLIGRWSSKHSWLLRVSAYDRELDRAWQLEAKEQRRLSARRNAEIADKAMQVVRKSIETYVQSAETEELALAPQDIARLMDAASKLERLALGESTENVTVTGPNGGPVQVDMTVLTDEERLARLAELRAEIDKRLTPTEGSAAS